MGKLVDGVWRGERYDTEKSGGRFQRSDSAFRDWVTADGSSGFAAGPGRHHLYVSLACPWARGTPIFRKLKGLEEIISVDVAHWRMAEIDFGAPHGRAARVMRRAGLKARQRLLGRRARPCNSPGSPYALPL